MKQTLSAASYEQYSPPVSPLICRRPLSAGTEVALRAACTAVVTSYDMQDDDVAAVADSVLASEDLLRTFNSYSKHSSKDSRLDGSSSHPSKYSYKPDAAQVELLPVSTQERRLMQTQHTYPKRKEGSSKPIEKQVEKQVEKHSEKPQLVRGNSMPGDGVEDMETMSPIERPKTAPFRDSSDVSVSTPLSASTDGRIVHHASTTMTTAAVTPSRPSNRGSQSIVLNDDQYQAAVEQADAAAAEWMRRELEKRRQKQDRERAVQTPQTAQASQPVSQRPPSRSGVGGRARSLSNGIRDYIRPRTASNSRPASRNGRERSDSAGITRTPSQSHGWRSWSLQRRPSVDSVSGSSSAFQSDPRFASKKEVDLNRPLPALPSVDTYKPPEPKTSAAGHIANLMRPKVKEPPKEAQARIVNIQRVKVAPQSLPTLQTDSSKSTMPPPPPYHDAVTEVAASTPSHKRPAHSKSSSQDSCFSPASSGYPSKRSMDLMKAAERARSKSQENLRGRPRGESASSTQAPPPLSTSTTAATAPLPPIARKASVSFSRPSGAAPSSRPATRGAPSPASAAAMNFSRKLSAEAPRPPHRASGGITALPPMPPRAPLPRKSIAGLRRIVSSFALGAAGGGRAGFGEGRVEGVRA